MKILASFTAFLLLAFAALAQPTMLHPGQVLTCSSTTLNPGSQSIPCATDWNNDGLPDLLLGYQPAFKIALYLNTGSRSQYVFTKLTNVQAGGVDIYLPATGCGSPAPWVCDYDGDGKKDLLVGSGSDGRIWYYANTNTDAEPVFSVGTTLKKSGVDLTVGARATPYIHDWDEDGLPDLLTGDASGYVHLFRNVGTRAVPVYTNDLTLKAGTNFLNLGLRSTIRICDWDGDGVKDLIGAGSDNLVWCRNSTANSNPVLCAPLKLQAPVAGFGLTNIDTGYRMRVDLVDLNGDGAKDLLIGNWDGKVILYEGYKFALQAPVILNSAQGVVTWNSSPHLLYNVYMGSDAEAVTNLVKSKWASGGRQTSWTNAELSSRTFYRTEIAP